MPTLAVNNFNIVCATLVGFITLFGLVSYLMKEKYYLSEACKLLNTWVWIIGIIGKEEHIANLRVFSNITHRWTHLFSTCNELD